MQEIFITSIWVIGIYLVGMCIPYIVAAKIIGYDNMVSDEQDAANWIIVFSWIGVVVATIIGIVLCFKWLLDFILKIKKT